MTTSAKINFYTLVGFIFLLAIAIQSHTIINWDVSYLMHASQKLTEGGTYTNDFFETNPPMILFLYIPPVILSKYLSLHLVASLRFYVFLLAGGSLGLIWRLGQRIFTTQKDKVIFCYFIVGISAAFLLLPAHEFGQREHLTIMLIFPYLLACALRLSLQKIPLTLTIVVGILAGLGFAIKPFFLLPLCLIELGMIIYRRNIHSVFRPETITIMGVMLLYLVLVYWITPDYIYFVLPWLWDLYYAGFHTSLLQMIFQDRFLFFLVPIIFSCITWKQKNYRELKVVLLLAMVGFAVSYLWANTLWFYHILPLLTLAIALTCLLCAISFPLTFTLSLNNFAHLIYWGAIFWFPILLMLHCTTYIVKEKNQGSRHHLAQWLKHHEKYNTCYFVSTNAYDFPAAVDYANKLSVSRFPNHWWLAGIINLSKQGVNSKKIELAKTFFIKTVVEDIEKNQPDLLLVDARPHNTELNDKNINYLTYYSSQYQFKKQLTHYHFLAKVEDFDIYARLSGSDSRS